jgi:hypothetical protein
MYILITNAHSENPATELPKILEQFISDNNGQSIIALKMLLEKSSCISMNRTSLHSSLLSTLIAKLYEETNLIVLHYILKILEVFVSQGIYNMYNLLMLLIF